MKSKVRKACVFKVLTQVGVIRRGACLSSSFIEHNMGTRWVGVAVATASSMTDDASCQTPAKPRHDDSPNLSSRLHLRAPCDKLFSQVLFLHALLHFSSHIISTTKKSLLKSSKPIKLIKQSIHSRSRSYQASCESTGLSSEPV